MIVIPSIEEWNLQAVAMADFDYEALLDRARDKIPDNLSSKSRWKLPEPQILIEGSNTIFRKIYGFVICTSRQRIRVNLEVCKKARMILKILKNIWIANTKQNNKAY